MEKTRRNTKADHSKNNLPGSIYARNHINPTGLRLFFLQHFKQRNRCGVLERMLTKAFAGIIGADYWGVISSS